jgi:hypothetical protein
LDLPSVQALASQGTLKKRVWSEKGVWMEWMDKLNKWMDKFLSK